MFALSKSYFPILGALAPTLVLFQFSFSLTMAGKPTEWSHFVFAQEWLPAFCLESDRKCIIPKEVHSWSVHGLWPSSDEAHPYFCNKSWPLRANSLKSILHALEGRWPNVYDDSSENAFWEYEWLKHGTCASILPEFNTELKYFTRILELHDKYNIYEFLRKAGINPSDKQPVLLEDIKNAIKWKIDKRFELFCRNYKNFAFPVLTSIHICLDKSVQVIDCAKMHESECSSPQILYLPLNSAIASTGLVLSCFLVMLLHLVTGFYLEAYLA